MKRLKRLTKYLIEATYALLVILVIFLAGSVILQSFNSPFQYRIYSVDSGSMRPTIDQGSIIMVQEAETYSKGDIISFSKDNNPYMVTTHRIDEVKGSNYITKGDANNAPDPGTVSSRNVIGKVVFRLPYLGYPITFSRTKAGYAVLIVVPALIIIIGELITIFKESRKLLRERKIGLPKLKDLKIRYRMK